MDTGSTLFVVVLVVVILAIVIWIATISRRAQRISAASDARLAAALQDVAAHPPDRKPFADETPAERSADVIAMSRDDDDSPAEAASVAAATKESRLAELTDLNARGLISADELAAGRATIIAE
jgi:flagellar biosynthesis/type III secretory pathway M-ring protein FliF/YscJ